MIVSQKHVIKFLAYLLVGGAVLSGGEWRPRAAGTISGLVFEDFNGNGVLDTTITIPNDSGFGVTPAAVDRGRLGIEVRAYDSSGVQQGPTAVTDAAGAYAIPTGGTGPYRVEFTNLPAGYHPSAVAPGATGNRSTVQFVPDGNTGSVNLGILNPANFCRDNPTLVTSCFAFGDNVTGQFNVNPVLVDFPYSAGSNSATDAASYFIPNTHSLMVPANQAGSAFGLGYRQATNTIYASAFMKKHAGFGPAGNGAIYAVNPTTGATILFADLNAIFGPGTAGIDGHAGNGGDYTRDNGDLGWDAVGKTSLGGLEVSADGSKVYVVNLANRQVYEIPTSGPITAATVRHVAIPLSAPGATGVNGADLRPFGLQWYRGQLYLGIVNSAESTQLPSDLRAYVYRLDPAALTFSAAPVIQFALNYPRGKVFTLQAGGEGEWLPWSPTFVTNSPGTAWGPLGIYPQPMLSGLSFDVDGNLVIGLRDRAGDQFGFFATDAPFPSTTLYEGMAGGDTLLAALNVPGNLNSGWTLESNAQAGPFGPTAGVNNNQGPGGGEYFFDDSFIHANGTLIHEEVSGGAVFQVPGFPDVMTSEFDAGRTTRTGGFSWLRKSNGTETKGYDLYLTTTTGASFSKGNGLGEVVAICAAAPIEIGNRVWDDTDGDGVQDPNEPALDNVVVQLFAPDGTTLLGTATTANGGEYYFSSAAVGPIANGVYGIAGLTPNTAGFQIRIALGQAALGGRVPTVPDADGSTNGDSRDSDGVPAGGDAVITLATGPAGANNHTYDFGFVGASLSLGDLVWYDTNDNGIVDAGEQPIPGVDMLLYRDNGDGVFNQTTDTGLGSRTTSAAGLYLFTGLLPGNYFVQVSPAEFGAGQTLSGYQNSTGQQPGDANNNRDHGVPAPVPGQGIVSELVTLSVGGEPVTDGDTDPNTNLTIDFGFYRLSLGDFVFVDADNSGTFNAGDTPRDGVAVELLNGAGTVVLQSTVTAGGGLYGFSGLTTGDYRVRITPPAGFTSSTGGGSEPAPDPDNDLDNDDNGTTTGATITSLPVTLTPGAEPVVNNGTGETRNPTVDFGLIQPQPPLLSLGNFVWLDYNDNGTVQPGEPGIDGVTVRLLNGTGTTVLATQATAGGGRYLFTGLAPGNYVVEIVRPSFAYTDPFDGKLKNCCLSSNFPGYEPAPDPDNDVDNDDNGTDVVQSLVARSLPVTLSFGAEPVNDGDLDPNSNLTVDFGFFGTGGDPDQCIAVQVPAFATPGGTLGPMRIGTINQGPGPSGALVIDGPIPSGTTLVSAAPSVNGGASGVCTVSPGTGGMGDTLECTWPGPHPSGRQQWVDVTLQVSPSAQHGQTIPLWFMASGSIPGGACMFDANVFVVSGGPTADLVLTASATAGTSSGRSVVAAPNQPMQTTFTVKNNGTIAAHGQYALIVDVPGALDVSALSVNQGWASGSGPSSGVFDTGQIPPGGSTVLNVTFVPRTTSVARIDIVRIAGSPADPDARNDRADLVIDSFGGGGSLAIGNVNGISGGELVVAAGQGELPQVRVFNGSGEELITPFYAFDRAFRGGVRLASCDVDGNGSDELVVAQGPGGSRVRVLSLLGGIQNELASFSAFEPGFTGGVNVACADTNGDGRAEVVVGPDGGRAPDVRTYAIGGGIATLSSQFQAYEPGFAGGVRVAAAAFPGSAVVGSFHIVTMPGPGRAGDLRAWRVSGPSAALVAEARVFAGGGANVTFGDANGDGTLDLLLAPDLGTPRLLQVFSLGTGALLLDAPAGAGGFGSVRSAVGALLDAQGITRVVTAVGSGPGEPPIVVTLALTPGGAVYLRTIKAGEVP